MGIRKIRGMYDSSLFYWRLIYCFTCHPSQFSFLHGCLSCFDLLLTALNSFIDFQGLLGSVTCSYLPDSIKLELESPGKVSF